MQTISFNYGIMSRKDQRKSDRIQLFFATFSLIMGYLDSLQDYTGWLILIPVVSLTIALFNTGIVILYNKIDKKYGWHMEAIIFRIAGMMILLSALGFQFIGHHHVQYVLYAMALLYLIILPKFVIQIRPKMIINFQHVRIQVLRPLMAHSLELSWQDITAIEVNKNLIKIKNTKRKKFRKFFLYSENPEDLFTLENLLNLKQKEYGFALNFRN